MIRLEKKNVTVIVGLGFDPGTRRAQVQQKDVQPKGDVGGKEHQTEDKGGCKRTYLPRYARGRPTAHRVA